MDMAQVAVQGFFHDPPLAKLKVFIFFHMGVSLVCSMFEPDVSAFIAVLGYLAVLNNQIEPLNLYLVLQPVSIVVDIIRMSIYSGKFSNSTGNFLIFLVIMKIVGKLLAIWFGYQLSKEWESAPDNYQDFGGKQPVSAESGSGAYQVENPGMGGMGGGMGGIGGMGGGMPKVVHPAGASDSATIPAYQQQGYQGGLQ
ncbi:hypothetical protein HOP50_01g05350 [Chloropicon primus]|uniref:Uncharacterized protein n=1 Tax=Chloropicon primus TaxID=1764295 RepID=A0A5B8MCE1_9CHLO|nr:hypothetical protein A3770_01p05470 [Chloropicon primus]UPQ97244.1 hypothetical protein HOP50_01g05350 [Chloropicon primus]|eukprot:QDZ18029.1 hypothetical protein A3770_01p05470 [Chloropicon primus]